MTPDWDVASLWQLAKVELEPKGLRLIEHKLGSNYRISPQKPLAFDAFKELYHRQKLKTPGVNQPLLIQKASKAQKAEKKAANPNGKNCIDIEPYTVRFGEKTRVTRLQ